MARTELHFHALHSLDDGPTELAESVELMSRAVADGTDTVVATPHVRSDMVTDVRDFDERVAELQGAARAAGLDIRLHTGGELGHDMVGRLAQSELDSIAQGPPDGRWLLVEAPFAAIDDSFHAATDELRDRGFGVLVAHPERSADASLDGASGLRHELGRGSLAQVNAQSITGAHGPTRPPLLGQARAELVAGGIDAALAAGLTDSGPRRLLARGIRVPVALVA